MNRRIKKKHKKSNVLLVVRCKQKLSSDGYIKLSKSIKNQLDQGRVVILPSFVEVEGIFDYNNKIQVEVRK